MPLTDWLIDWLIDRSIPVSSRYSTLAVMLPAPAINQSNKHKLRLRFESINTLRAEIPYPPRLAFFFGWGGLRSLYSQGSQLISCITVQIILVLQQSMQTWSNPVVHCFSRFCLHHPLHLMCQLWTYFWRNSSKDILLCVFSRDSLCYIMVGREAIY